MGDRQVWRHFDYLSFSVMLVLSGLGLLLVTSATQAIAPPHHPLYYTVRQVLWIALGLGVLFVTTAVPYERFKALAPYVWGLAVLLLLVVLVKGHAALGAQRWIQLGPFELQPSEFSKVAVVLGLATYLDREERLTRWRDIAKALAVVAVPMLLILKQPDLGTALVLVAIVAAMFYIAGVPGWKMLLMFPGGLAVVVLWIYLHFRFHLFIPMHQYQLNRLIIFLDPQTDPLGAGFNVIQARIAVGSGGMWGAGLFGASPSQLSFLPESYTDFIYAVIGEELGFVGAAAVLFLYFLLIVRGLSITAQSRDRFGSLLAAGVTALFAFHVLESAGMASGVMPVAGVPLPFVSYGGSAYLTDAASLGLMINVFMRRHAVPYPETQNKIMVYSTRQIPE
ncbi:MAG: rod shape-determining protein RodA [Firmicutes bacterium]|nr:rod shape-determining protein RodA [Bacillota bacterium]